MRFLYLIILLLTIQAQATSNSTNTVSFMTYNVENLFDNIKDENKDDYEYLPLSEKKSAEHKKHCNAITNDFYKKACLEYDYSDKVVAEKLKRISNTILQVRGVGADIVVVNEVENIGILNRLNKEYLKDAQYQTVKLIEGDDGRGIDVGILSRFPIKGRAKLHQIEFFDPKTHKPVHVSTRGILEVPLQLPNGDVAHVLAFHFPSQSNPGWMRADAVNMLNKILKGFSANDLVIAGGDSNIITQEERDMGYFSRVLSPNWNVSHLVGCQSCEGTHYYKGEWAFLDVLLFSAPQSTSYNLVTSSIQTLKGGKYQIYKDGTPARFDEKGAIGVSDHLPLYLEFTY